MNNRLQVLALIAVIGASAWYAYSQHIGLSFQEFFFSVYSTIHVGTTPIKVEVADTPESQRIGLSGRDELVDISGLLMVFDEPGYYGIWMKGMRFPIDIIWISEDHEVIDIRQHVTPGTYPQIFEPPQPVKYVLETKAFFTDVFGIRVGDKVDLPGSLK